MGQGEVAALLEAPEEVLLSHLEEASGLKPVAEGAKVAEERLAEASSLLEQREKELVDLHAQATRLQGEAEAARRARELDLKILALKASLLAARIEEAQWEVQRARERLEALNLEEESLKRDREALELRGQAVMREEEALRTQLEAVRLSLKRAGRLGKGT